MRKKKYALTALFLSLFCFGVVGFSSAAEPQTHKNSIGMEFVLIPAGSFMMGEDPNLKRVGNDEMPQHKVILSKPFYMGKYEVTQAQWEAVMESNPSKFKAPDNPVEQVSWKDVEEFIRRLNLKERHTRYRLPTEAEWEYAARAGTSSAYSFGNDKNELFKYAWYDEDYKTGSTHSIGKKLPNPWGLYDVHGNVAEWVQDWYGKKYYANSPETDPKGPSRPPHNVLFDDHGNRTMDYNYISITEGFDRVLRGGAWTNFAEFCRPGSRDCTWPDNWSDRWGFRLALSLE